MHPLRMDSQTGGHVHQCIYSSVAAQWTSATRTFACSNHVYAVVVFMDGALAPFGTADWPSLTVYVYDS